MPFTWVLVRNHEQGAPKDLATLSDEIDAGLLRFEDAAGSRVDGLLREEMGVGEWLVASNAVANFSHPISRIERHGDFILLNLAVPASLSNGIADFTNVTVLAHEDALLMIIKDPQGSYAAEFGGQLLHDFRRHAAADESTSEWTVSLVLNRILRSCVVSLEMAISKLRAGVREETRALRRIENNEIQPGTIIDRIEAHFGRVLAELRALRRTPVQMRQIGLEITEWLDDPQIPAWLVELDLRRTRYLDVRLQQLEAMVETFIEDLDRGIKRCDDVNQRQLLEAQKSNTFWTSALLLPNLVFAFFGMSFPDGAREFAWFWWLASAGLGAYGVVTIVYWARRSRR